MYEWFVEMLQIFDVFWGRRSKIYHGIKDGGAKATEIGNTDIAKVFNGSTIFNVNHPDNECSGGHYHDFTESADSTPTVKTGNLNCQATDNIGDWVIISGDDTVTKVTDNTQSQIFGVICEKENDTTCKVVTHGKANIFSGLDSSQKRYFLSNTGTLTPTVQTGGWIIELGKAINSTTLYVDIRISLKRN